MSPASLNDDRRATPDEPNHREGTEQSDRNPAGDPGLTEEVGNLRKDGKNGQGTDATGKGGNPTAKPIDRPRKVGFEGGWSLE
jgi:hypothetical protein